MVTAVIAEPFPHPDRAGARVAAEPSELELNEAIEAVVQTAAMPRGGRD